MNLLKPMKGEEDRITVAVMRGKSKKKHDYYIIDEMHIFSTILSRELPTERFGGIINLHLTKLSTATDEEIEDSLVSAFVSSFICSIPFSTLITFVSHEKLSAIFIWFWIV